MAFRRTIAALSPKQNFNTHPKNAVRWRPGGNGFYQPHYGASKMKWQFRVPYVREVDSLHHYPEVSRITGKAIDWYHGEPEDGYDGVRMFGENTLELQGMPLGKTPEYMQERLRRFFSKFGPIKHCRAEPHSHDPYQCEGKAWITFRDKEAAFRALRAPLKFPASLHDKVVSMRHLDTDKRNDPDYFEKSKFWNTQVISVLRQLYTELSTNEELRAHGKPLQQIASGLWERELVAAAEPPAVLRGRGGIAPSKGLAGAATRVVPAGPAVMLRCGSWEGLLTEIPFDELFTVQHRGGDESAPLVVLPRLRSAVQRTRILHKGQMVLARRLHDEFSVYWREGRVQLPEYTQSRVDFLHHKPKLPFELQIMSRSKDRVRIFDEKYLYRQQLARARNVKRKERRADWNEEKLKMKKERDEGKERRRAKNQAAIEKARCNGLMGRSPGLYPGGLMGR